ncbi:histidine kinase [Roseivirga sp. UBA838]|uniref:sensor histidine kinase n=1 Tax=Roseivirga sp. UBA838 TaxID=1947393 RepID=UPI00257DFAD9|nr:histidine kinase [Roseivirga sp. UBA838]|tara:strand:- start:111059 stop:112084 length:1026 start_codon:yes stop_codon:yes gene_type:complete
MGYLQNLNWKTELRNTFLIFFFGSFTSFLWCFSCIWEIEKEIFSMTFTGLMWVFLWQGNGHLSDYLSSKISWLENPLKRFIWGILGVLVYSPAAVYFLYLMALWTLNIKVDNVGTIALISIGITFVISFFLNAAEFLRNWKQTALDAERLKKEQMATRYESLKNQVNPHFLFNSLNALTNLVYEDQDLAADFIRQLSKVYRYVLETRSKEVVSLETEMKFVESYLFLQHIRFDDKLRVEASVSGFENRMLPPLALQMLLENAIKHNTIAKDEPLTISIRVEEDMLVVENNLQIKNIPTEESSGMGLANIKARYEFLSDKPVVVEKTESYFRVKLPLLSISE